MQLQSSPLRSFFPSVHDLISDGTQMLRDVMASKLADCRNRSHWTDAFGPVRATHECRLRSLHDFCCPDHRRHRITICHRLSEDRYIRTYFQKEVDSAIRHAKAGSYLIEDQDGPDLVRNLSYLLQESFQRLLSPLRFHDDCCDFRSVGGDDALKLIDLVVMKRQCGTVESARHSTRLQTWQEVCV